MGKELNMAVGTQSALTPLAAAPSSTFDIPAAAWRTPIGQAYAQPGRVRVDQPLIDDGPWGGVPQGGRSQAHVLATVRPEALSAWNWDLPEGAGTYHGLFPKAWFAYDWAA